MFKLFANIFDKHDEKTSLPDSLIGEAIERAVDGTDPRLRMVPGYAKTLRTPVIHALEHTVQLIARVPAAIPLTHAGLQSDPVLAALFYSPRRLDEFLRRDAALLKYCRDRRPFPQQVIALLAVQKTEKHGFGVGLLNDRVVREVARTTVSFDQRRLLDPTDHKDETRRLLQRRAFDLLLSIALGRVAERREIRSGLAERRRLLRCKLDILERQGSFAKPAEAGELARLQERLGEIEQQLAALGSIDGVLPRSLATVAKVLGEAERHLWLEDAPLCLGRDYVLHKQPSLSAPQIPFREFHDSAARKAVVLMVAIPGEQLPRS